MKTRNLPGLLMVLAGSLAIAIATPSCADDPFTEVSIDECATGRKWTAGNQESDEMRPGGNCIGCHQQEGEGPSFAAAGTVYPNVDAADDCAGSEGATITITDANGAVFTTTSNFAGNFYWRNRDMGIALPYTATLTFQGQSRPMETPQTDLNCANCHTQSGANDAPGRIVLP